MKRKKGFTLVELLIVIIIIGVLAAIAVPQFMNAVEKARGAEAKAVFANVHRLERMYFAENDEYTEVWGDLDVSLSATGKSWNFTIVVPGADDLTTGVSYIITATRNSGVQETKVMKRDENGLRVPVDQEDEWSYEDY